MTNDKCHKNKGDHNWKPECYCFSDTTQILTNFGMQWVSDLGECDLVLTRDNGFQPILNVTRHHYYTETVSFSGGLEVTPSHRVMVNHPYDCEFLVAAKHVGKVLPKCGGEFYHIELPNHELVFADGMWAETLFNPERHKSLARPELTRYEAIAMNGPSNNDVR